MEFDIFPEPSGDVAGVGFVTGTVAGKETRLAHVMFLTDKEPEVSIDIRCSYKATPDELDDIADKLKAFSQKIRELSAKK